MSIYHKEKVAGQTEKSTKVVNIQFIGEEISWTRPLFGR